VAFDELALVKVGEASSKTSINGRRVFAAARMAAAILVLGGGSEVGAGKDNMSRGSNEQMFGKKEQVPDGGQSN